MCIQPNIHTFQCTGTHLFGKLHSLLVEINYSRIWKFQCNVYIYVVGKNFVSNNFRHLTKNKKFVTFYQQKFMPTRIFTISSTFQWHVKLNSTNQYLSAPSSPHSLPFPWSLDRKDCLNTKICRLKIPFIRGHKKVFVFRQAYATYFFRLLLAYVSLH